MLSRQLGHYPNLLLGCLYSGWSSLGLGHPSTLLLSSGRPAVCDNPLPKHEGMATMENPVSMSSGDSLQDWSSDSISSHQTQVRSPAVQKLQLQLAQALIALSLINYIILFVFLTWYVIFFLGGGGGGGGGGCEVLDYVDDGCTLCLWQE